MHFHKKMIFNRSYGVVGLLALPYFLIFEIIGPIIEFQGYVMVIIAAFLGIIDARLGLLLFIATILMGIIVSISALFIAERESDYFKLGDLFKLILYAFLENLGPRQIISFWRLRGQFRVIFRDSGWGQIKRKGVS
jgi:hypothetical protein